MAYGQGGEGLRLLLCSSRDLMEEQKDEADMHVCDACFNAAIAPLSEDVAPRLAHRAGDQAGLESAAVLISFSVGSWQASGESLS